MNIKPFKPVDWRFRPLPDIANDVMEFTKAKGIDGTGGTPMLEINISSALSQWG